ncbi:MAG: GMC family oxidoreductase N-terminal domain-containing protein [Pseudomonas sp.]|uniref:GMC family oxidoreductase n=1 Tax=Pseudomonas abieticivorans TaxID=2931382 RepID=UPI0020C0F096|nr:GMC family oxidoreductase N-terminal domain-containing protein [Pseudomonas sp. PIA16]MDE1166675.1 GMC family oxidoreductase N-terminal domain-containing protein [Pseudomonas sp.]
MLEKNYVIVGGGTTGCILAAKLSEDPAATVLLLEEGPRDSNPYIRFPGTYYKTCQGPLLKRYPWESASELGRGPGDSMIQACVLGGGSSINGMVYARGNPADYDEWAQSGAAGWAYADVLPYYLRSEDNSDFCNSAHGVGGPLGVSFNSHVHPLTRKWLQACQQAGFAYNPDFNSGTPDGCGYYQVASQNGVRASSASAYLRPALQRPNLQVITGAKASRLIIEKGRATGVEYVHRGLPCKVAAASEVILCAGAINSPKLLMLSGIGAAADLQALGLAVKADLPGVGRNLQDHLEMSQVYQLKGVDSYDKFKKPHWKAWAALQYLVARSGPIATNLIEGGLFARGSRTEQQPDLQYFFIVGAGIEEGTDSVPGGTGCTLNFEHVRPRSRGQVSLRSADPHELPRIAPNYMAEQYDVDRLCEGYRIGQDIMAQPAFSGYVARQHYPDVTFTSQAQLAAYLKRNARAALHPVGTCRMGVDALSVVDPQLRVHGIDNLRVADASIMPNIVSGNTNAACTLIGERAADLIRGLPPLAPGAARDLRQSASHRLGLRN